MGCELFEVGVASLATGFLVLYLSERIASAFSAFQGSEDITTPPAHGQNMIDAPRQPVTHAIRVRCAPEGAIGILLTDVRENMENETPGYA